MSSSIALRRSPKPGAFTAATFNPPRSLLTTSVAKASPSTFSAIITSGFEVCTTASSRIKSRYLPSVHYGSVRTGVACSLGAWRLIEPTWRLIPDWNLVAK